MEVKKRKNRFVALLLVTLLVLQCFSPIAALAETAWYAFDSSELEEDLIAAGEQIASGKNALLYHPNKVSDNGTYTLDTGCVLYPGDRISVCTGSSITATVGYLINGSVSGIETQYVSDPDTDQAPYFGTISVADYPDSGDYAGWIVTNLYLSSGRISLIELSLMNGSDKTISYRIEKPSNAYKVYNVIDNPLYYSPAVGVNEFKTPAKKESDDPSSEAVFTGFIGWFEDENYSGDPITSIAPGTRDEDIVLYGLYEGLTDRVIVYKDDKGFVIPSNGTKNENGVSFTDVSSNPSKYTEGLLLSVGSVTKENYDFTGWYCKKSGNFSTTSDFTEENLLPDCLRGLRGDVELYAGFKPKDIKYDIEYVLNGGINSQSNPAQYSFGVGVSSLEAPSRKGYDFDGWYVGDVKVSSDSPVISTTDTGKKTFTAKWTPKTYTITYYYGENLLTGNDLGNNPVTYTYGTGVTKFKDLVKKGYVFEGFYESKESQTRITSIPVDATGNKILYARFSEEEPAGSTFSPISNVSIKTFSYSFVNNSDGLRYAESYRISEERFKEVFGNKGSFMNYFYNDEWGGNCYGLSATSSMFNVKGNEIEIADFEEGFKDAAKTVNDYKVRVDGAPSDANKDEVKRFIEQMQISQFDVRVQLCYILNTGIAETINALKSELKANKPMIIGLFGPEGGHAVLAYKFEETDKDAKIHIYDSNWPNVDCYIAVIKENGTYKYWYYDLMDVYNKEPQGLFNYSMLWGNYPALISDKDRIDGSDITFIPYDIYATTYFNKGYYSDADWLISDSDNEQWTQEDEEAYLDWVWSKFDEEMYNSNSGNQASLSLNYRIRSRLKYRLKSLIGYSMEIPMKTLVVGNGVDYEIQDANGKSLASIENNELVLKGSSNRNEIFQAKNLRIMPNGSAQYNKAIVYLPADRAQRIVKDENAAELDVAVMNKDMVLSVSTEGDAVSMNVDAENRQTSVELEGDGTVSISGQKGDTFEIKVSTENAGVKKTSMIKGTVNGSGTGSSATGEQSTISISGNEIKGTGVDITEKSGFNDKQEDETETSDSCTHKHYMVKGSYDATCTGEGYSGDLYCFDCGAQIMIGHSISAKGHTSGEPVKENLVEATEDKAGSYDEVIYCKDCGALISQKHVTINPIEKNNNEKNKTKTRVKNPAPRKSVFTDAKTGADYIVTKSVRGAAEVALKSIANVTKTTFTVPASVTFSGVKYKVTSIYKYAFKDNQNIRKVVIGKNVVTIERKAFKNCRNLKKITFKSGFEAIGTKAFSKIYKNAIIKIPAISEKEFEKLKNLVLEAGADKKVRFQWVEINE